MKKTLAFLLALMMVFALAACGETEPADGGDPAETPSADVAETPPEAATPDEPETPDVPETPDEPAQPETPATGEPGEIYVTVVNGGVVELAAAPVTPDEMTLVGAIVKAHELYFNDGAAGYEAGIDPTYNMFLISKAWGVNGVPFISQGAAMAEVTETAPVSAGDNIVITTSGAPNAVILTVADGTVTATSQTLDFATFQYMSAAVSGAKLIGSDGTELGVTGEDGTAAITVPSDGVIIAEGLAAVKAS
ncbi:MAG: hypothetical protein LBD49_03625 [Oscillospiraceae bacterium]|jgi:predicted small lipoprotein YifL|nr:hypothetical protein [Oscillospiraceae bacterium]